MNVRQLWLSALKRKVRDLNTASENCVASVRILGKTSSCHHDGGPEDHPQSGDSVS